MSEETSKSKTDTRKFCIPCKVIAYSATLGFVIYGYNNIKRQPAAGGLICAIGLFGFCSLFYKDVIVDSKK